MGGVKLRAACFFRGSVAGDEVVVADQVGQLCSGSRYEFRNMKPKVNCFVNGPVVIITT